MTTYKVSTFSYDFIGTPAEIIKKMAALDFHGPRGYINRVLHRIDAGLGVKTDAVNRAIDFLHELAALGFIKLTEIPEKEFPTIPQ